MIARAPASSLRIAVVAALAALSLGRAAGQDAAAPPKPAVSLNPLGAIDASTLSGFRERPLFTPTRRAPEPPPEAEAAPEPEIEVAAPPPPAPEPNLRLTGVVESPEESVAVVQNLDGNAMERLRLGDSVGGWLVTSIEAAALRLTLGEREEEYRLFDATGRRSPPDETLQDPAAAEQ